MPTKPILAILNNGVEMPMDKADMIYQQLYHAIQAFPHPHGLVAAKNFRMACRDQSTASITDKDLQIFLSHGLDFKDPYITNIVVSSVIGTHEHPYAKLVNPYSKWLEKHPEYQAYNNFAQQQSGLKK